MNEHVTSLAELDAWLATLGEKPARKPLYEKAQLWGFAGNKKDVRAAAGLEGPDEKLAMYKMEVPNLVKLLR